MKPNAQFQHEIVVCFRAFLSSRDQDIRSIVRRRDQSSVPIVNAFVSYLVLRTNYGDFKGVVVPCVYLLICISRGDNLKF